MNFFLTALITFGALIAGMGVMAGLTWCVDKYKDWMDKSASRVVISCLAILATVSVIFALIVT